MLINQSKTKKAIIITELLKKIYFVCSNFLPSFVVIRFLQVQIYIFICIYIL